MLYDTPKHFQDRGPLMAAALSAKPPLRFRLYPQFRQLLKHSCGPRLDDTAVTALCVRPVRSRREATVAAATRSRCCTSTHRHQR
jgi:hypothetical protein